MIRTWENNWDDIVPFLEFPQSCTGSSATA